MRSGRRLLLLAVFLALVAVELSAAAPQRSRDGASLALRANAVCAQTRARVRADERQQLPGELVDAILGQPRDKALLVAAGNFQARVHLPAFATELGRLRALAAPAAGSAQWTAFLAYRRAFLAAFVYQVRVEQTGDYTLQRSVRPTEQAAIKRADAAARALGAPDCHL